MKVHELDKDEARCYNLWNAGQRQANPNKVASFAAGWRAALRFVNMKGTAYPEFCREPALCKGKGYCPRDPTCID